MDFDILKDDSEIIKLDLDDDDDDIPSDFFDDFLNNEFMDGLDVVDAWDDENEKREGRRQRKSASKSRTVRMARSRRRRSRSRSLLRQRYRDEYNMRRARSRDRSPRGRRSYDRRKDIDESISRKDDTNLKSKEPVDGDDANPDHRRDPEKTKRDIQKDKDKRAKNEEDKFINEKLKVVETGLVPPGMELDFDINTLPPCDKKEKKETKPADKHNEKRKSASPKKVVRKRSPPTYGISSNRIGYKPLSRYRSPIRRRTRSPNRSPSRKRIRSSERRYISDRSRFIDYSPDRCRQLSRDLSLELSPDLRSSDRKSWRSPDRLSKGSSRRRSVSRRRGVDFLEELAKKLAKSEKKKYLKKVQQIMNQPAKRVPNYPPMPHIPPPTPVPAPISMPIMRQGSGQFCPPHVDPSPQYDHHFFIGQQFPAHFQPPSFPEPPPNVMPNSIVEVPITHPPQAPPPVNIFPIAPRKEVTTPNADVASAISNIINIEMQKDKEAVNKLFEEKRISLSDFLSMSAKHTGHSEPINVQKKIKVISLCQDAVKALGGDLQLCGRFFFKKTLKEPEKLLEGKFNSPLRKIPVVRFSFTTPSRGGDEKITMQTTLSKLISSLGLVENLPEVILKPPVLNTPTLVSNTPKPVVNTPNPVLNTPKLPVNANVQEPIKQHTPTPFTQRSVPPRNNFLSQPSSKLPKMCQTDPIKCQVCEVRKSRTFASVEVQCEPTRASVSTQITDDDLIRMGVKFPTKDNLKNQSFAHLTPAQLMRQTLGEEDNLQRPNYSPLKMQPNLPDKPFVRPLMANEVKRPTLSGNDNFARTPFGFDNRPEVPMSNFNPSYRPTQFENRPRPFEGQDRVFIENRNSNVLAGNSNASLNRMLPNPFAARKY